MYTVPGYSHVATSRPQGDASQLGAGRIDVRDLQPGLLAILERVGEMLRQTVVIFSGYRTSAYSASVGGFAGDPHSRRIAVDATVGGKPLGAALSTAEWAQLGITSGNTPGFFHGQPDPTHVQLSSSGDRLGAPTPAATGTSLTDFVDALLQAIGAPVNAANRLLVAAWISAEGTKARFNPLATTQSAPGASNFNSVGVKNYPTFAAGVHATAQTLQNGRYPGILSSLRSGTAAPNDVVNRYAREFNTWGTGAGAVASQLHGLQGGKSSALFPGVGKWLTSLPGGNALFGGGPANLQNSVMDFGRIGELIGNLVDPHWWLRVLELLGGGVLVLTGLYLLAKQIGLPSPAGAIPSRRVAAAAAAA